MFSDLTLNISDLVKSVSLVEICDSYVLCLTSLSDTLQLQLTTAEFGEDYRCYSFLIHVWRTANHAVKWDRYALTSKRLANTELYLGTRS